MNFNGRGVKKSLKQPRSETGLAPKQELITLLFLSYRFSLSGRPRMGLRGLHAKPVANHLQPPDELLITAAAVRLYKRLRALEMHCECPPDEELLKFSDWDERACENCKECWRLNLELGACFGLAAWEIVYEDPRWNLSRSSKSAIDRFHALEAAASKRTKEPRFRYKWEK